MSTIVRLMDTDCRKAGYLLLCLLPAVVQFHAVSAQESNELEIHRMPGGLMPVPVIKSIDKTESEIVLEWFGWGAPYQVERAGNLNGAPWEKVGGSTDGTSLSLPLDGELGILRVLGSAPSYVGATTCSLCHSGTHADWEETKHATALETLKRINQHNNSHCVVCHTAGHGLPTGFVDEATTPHLAGVQCENCHGPGGDHAANPMDLTKRPKVTPKAEMCGGCHTDPHHPTYEEFVTSDHADVHPVPASSFISGGAARINSCGSCHSGSARLAMLKGDDLPDGNTAASVGITCAVCHNSHELTANGSQLRYPRASMKHFSYSTRVPFAEQHDPEVQLCGQCHNMRGAQWTDTSRPPHHSPQYNMLIGSGGVVSGTPPQSYHRNIENQCAHCHTHPHEVENPTFDNPNTTGHSFHVTTTSCLPCHTEEGAELFKNLTQSGIEQRIAEVKALLDEWATTKAPESLRTKYGALAWEYNHPGDLSESSGDGPTGEEQAAVPDAIKQARFNLYLVLHDGSKGVHNADYMRYLLSLAEAKVRSELENDAGANVAGLSWQAVQDK